MNYKDLKLGLEGVYQQKHQQSTSTRRKNIKSSDKNYKPRLNMRFTLMMKNINCRTLIWIGELSFTNQLKTVENFQQLIKGMRKRLEENR